MSSEARTVPRYDGTPRHELVEALREATAEVVRWTNRIKLLDARHVLARDVLEGRRDDLLGPQPEAPFSLATLQREQAEWARRNFGEQPAWCSVVGAMEELGELAHALLKSQQGIRGTDEEHRAAAADAVADVIVFLAGFCSATKIDLEKTVRETWGEVKQRDWAKDRKNGGAR